METRPTPDDEAARTTAQLRDSEERYRLIVEGARDYAIITMDPDGRVDGWSPGAVAVFGWPADEIIGQPVGVTFTPEDRVAGEHGKELAMAREHGAAPDVRWHQRKDGRRVFVEGVTRALRDERSELRGFLKIGQDVTRRRESEELLRVAEARRLLAAAEEDERRRIARELHDQLGQHLTALSLGIAEVRRLLEAGEVPAARLDQLEALAQEMTRDVRTLALELRPPELDDVGLESALATYVEQWSARCHIPAEFAARGFADDGRPPSEIATAVYRVAQEALTNVARHAQAREVSVTLDRAGDEVRLVVEDDGRGFDPGTTGEGTRAERRLGLVGMRERAALVRGTLDVESTPGGGTTIYLRVPLDDAASD